MTSDVTDSLVRDEQIRIVYGQAWPAVAGGIAAAAIFAWIYSATAEQHTLALWFAAQLTVYIARGALSLAFRRRTEGSSAGSWALAHLVGILITASLWGAIWALFVDADAPLHMAVAMMWALGLGASAVGAYSVHLPSFVAFYVPVVLPAFIYLLTTESAINTGIGLGLVAHVFVLVGAITHINRSMIESIRLNFALASEIEERRSIERKLRELSQRDGLTGLANRRHFDETLELEWRRARRDENPVSLILIDIDNFKTFNDAYGHLAGDECLVRVSHALLGAIKRPGDIAARYGGEEFAIVLPNTEIDSACEFAESLRASIEAMAIPHRTNEAAHDVVTISAGVATITPQTSIPGEALIRYADEALYRAKSAGRNRVISDSHREERH